MVSYILLVSLVVIGFLVILLAVIGFFMPSTVRLEEKLVINKAPDEIFHHLADFENFIKWSPWTEKDPQMKTNFSGEKFSVGHKYEWEGNRKVGKGSMEITHIEVNEKVNIDLEFGNRGKSKTGFILCPVSGGTEVKWFFETEMGPNPLAKVMGPMMRKFIGKDFSKGLHNLKAFLS